MTDQRHGSGLSLGSGLLVLPKRRGAGLRGAAFVLSGLLACATLSATSGSAYFTCGYGPTGALVVWDEGECNGMTHENQVWGCIAIRATDSCNADATPPGSESSNPPAAQ